MIKEFFNLILIFMIIFSFPIFHIIPSNKLAYLIVLFLILIKKKINLKIFKKKKILYFLIISMVVFIYMVIIPIFFKTFDFSLIRKMLSSFCMIFLIYFIYANYNFGKLDKLIINAFLIQSILIGLIIIFPEFCQITEVFREPRTLQHIWAYGNLRGTAISAYQYFGLSTMYGFVIIYAILSKEFYKLKDIIKIIILSIGGMISGRYTLVAIILGVLVKVFNKNFLKKNKKNIIYILIFFFLIIRGLSLFKDNIYVYKYFLVPLEVIKDKKNIRNISSLNSLMQMYENIKISNLYFGDGRYESVEGGYYKNVDIGYIRVIYFSGIMGLVILIYVQYYFIYKIYLTKKNKKIKLIFFIYFLLLNIKGDIFIYTSSLLPIIMGFLTNKDNKIMRVEKKYEQ